MSGRLGTQRQWFAQMPVELELENSVVQIAKDQGEGLRWFRTDPDGMAGVKQR